MEALFLLKQIAITLTIINWSLANQILHLQYIKKNYYDNSLDIIYCFDFFHSRT